MFVSTEMAGIWYCRYVVSVDNTSLTAHLNWYEVFCCPPGEESSRNKHVETNKAILSVQTAYKEMSKIIMYGDNCLTLV